MRLTKLFPFLIEKVISSKITPKNVKNINNGTMLLEVGKKRHEDILMKMMFHTSRDII